MTDSELLLFDAKWWLEENSQYDKIVTHLDRLDKITDYYGCHLDNESDSFLTNKGYCEMNKIRSWFSLLLSEVLKSEG